MISKLQLLIPLLLTLKLQKHNTKLLVLVSLTDQKKGIFRWKIPFLIKVMWRITWFNFDKQTICFLRPPSRDLRRENSCFVKQLFLQKNSLVPLSMAGLPTAKLYSQSNFGFVFNCKCCDYSIASVYDCSHSTKFEVPSPSSSF